MGGGGGGGVLLLRSTLGRRILIVHVPFQCHLDVRHMHYAHLYCASRSLVNAHLVVWCNSCEEDERSRKVFLRA